MAKEDRNERAARTDQYLESLKLGDRFESDDHVVSQGDIIEFGLKYDPQPFHVDAEASKKSPHGGLIASGFHVLALGFRLLYETGWMTSANIAGVGIDKLRFLRPVRPGDTLRSVTVVKEITPSRSKPDRGVVKHDVIVRNQHDEHVLTATFIILVKRKRSG